MSTPLCFIFTNAAVNGFFANLSRRFWWLFLKGCVSESLAAPLLSSPILNTLIFSAAVLFRGSLTFFMPLLTRGPLLAHLRKLPSWPCHPVPWGRVPCVPSSFPWPTFPGGGLGGSHSLWQAVHCSPPPPALSRPVHRPWRVPPTAYLGGGFWLFTSGGARVPRPDGGGPPGRCLDRPYSPLGRGRPS